MLFTLLVLAGPHAGAEPGAGVASEARDAAAAFVGTQNFVVGRLGRDCLALLARPESPAEYQQAWQRANARYYDASTRYMEARLAAIEDAEEQNAVESAYYASVNGRGEAAAAQILRDGADVEVCKRALALIDSGKMNVDEFVEATGQPVRAPLDELLEWAASD